MTHLKMRQKSKARVHNLKKGRIHTRASHRDVPSCSVALPYCIGSWRRKGQDKKDRQTACKSWEDGGGAGVGVRTQHGLMSLSFLRRGWKCQRALGRKEVEPKSPYSMLRGELARRAAPLAFWMTD